MSEAMQPSLKEEPVSNLNKLDSAQERLAVWQKENFDLCTPEQMLVGIVEELGELKHARGGYYEDPNPKRAKVGQYEAINDAKADILIYATQLASVYGIKVSHCWRRAGYRSDVLSILGELAHYVLKNRQGIREGRDSTKTKMVIESCLQELFNWVGTTYQNYLEVAETVLARNWKANPSTGEMHEPIKREETSQADEGPEPEGNQASV